MKQRHRTWPRNVALILPLILVNLAAVYGQAGWAHDALRRGGWLWAVLFAAAVETVGIYLAAEAHAALLAGHSSGALRLGSYAVGALSGCLNFAHFAGPGYAPTPLAVTFGLLSSISPWLWAIRSRAMNRARLFAAGLIDPRAVKFARLRWALFPLRTFAAFRLAVWEGVQSPTVAAERADAVRATRRPAITATFLPIDPPDDDSEPAARQIEATPTPTGKPALSLVPATRKRPVRTATRSKGATPSRDTSETRDRVIALHLADRDRRPSDIAQEVGCNTRTVQRHIASIRDSDRSDIS